jgi:hypothetical protein
MGLPYLVQQSDGNEKYGRCGFEFGGINGGVASFMNKGDAILYAQELRRRCPELAARVLNTGKRGSPEVFFSGERV